MNKNMVFKGLVLIGIVVVVSAFYWFLLVRKQERNRLQICPDEWIVNRMPRVKSRFDWFWSPPTTEYFIKDGKRREVEEFDTAWVKEHCAIEPKEVF